jgi:hypothetical protein
MLVSMNKVGLQGSTDTDVTQMCTSFLMNTLQNLQSEVFVLTAAAGLLMKGATTSEKKVKTAVTWRRQLLLRIPKWAEDDDMMFLVWTRLRQWHRMICEYTVHSQCLPRLKKAQ